MLEVSQRDLCVSSMCLYDIRGPWWLLEDDMTSLMRKGPSQDRTHKGLKELQCWWLTPSTLFMVFVTGNKQQTSDIHEPSNKLTAVHLLSFLILSTPARRLTNREASGNKVGAQSFPPSLWITIKANVPVFKSRTTIWLANDQWHCILFDIIIYSAYKALIKQCWKAI